MRAPAAAAPALPVPAILAACMVLLLLGAAQAAPGPPTAAWGVVHRSLVLNEGFTSCEGPVHAALAVDRITGAATLRALDPGQALPPACASLGDTWGVDQCRTARSGAVACAYHYRYSDDSAATSRLDLAPDGTLGYAYHHVHPNPELPSTRILLAGTLARS